MKKLLTIATLLVVFMGILSVNVNAATKKSTKNISDSINFFRTIHYISSESQ